MSVLSKTDWTEPIWWICILILIVLFAGEPDIHDTLIKRLEPCPLEHVEK